MDQETVTSNVSEARILGGRATGARKRLAQALEHTGPHGRDDEPSSHLSGGQNQRPELDQRPLPGCEDPDRRRAHHLARRGEPTKAIDLFADFAAQDGPVCVWTHDRAVSRRRPVQYQRRCPARDFGRSPDAMRYLSSRDCLSTVSP